MSGWLVWHAPRMLSYLGAAVALWIAVDLLVLLLIGAREPGEDE